MILLLQITYQDKATQTEIVEEDTLEKILNTLTTLSMKVDSMGNEIEKLKTNEDKLKSIATNQLTQQCAELCRSEDIKNPELEGDVGTLHKTHNIYQSTSAASIFAFGQISSGKMYTMSGITEYTLIDIYDHISRNEDRQFKLKFSAMEIDNDVVRDLLTPDDTPLRLLDDPELNFMAALVPPPDYRKAEYKEDRVLVDLKVPLHQSMSSVMTCLVEKRFGNKFSDNHWALRAFTEKLVALGGFSVPRLGFRLLQDKLRFSYENERKSLRSVLI
ncbi:hypothetical protein T459_21364 [Capsicum annuum]|uniref:Kinesin motor domain-containing protein n=1 Tax=Capsicum annuum TaxID=4072 RepID=A0A2G2YWE0_CAPAN|nr:hypothetical protein T459_21364 [Capsicum annuum]